MKVRIFADKTKTNKTGLVPLQFRVWLTGHKPFKIPVGINVTYDAWEANAQKVYKRAGQVDPDGTNAKITSKYNQLIRLVNRLEFSDIIITPDLIKTKYKELKQTPIIKTESKFYDYFDQYRERYKSVKASTYLNQFKTTQKILKQHLPNLDYDNIRPDIVDSFYHYLINAGYSHNTIVSHIKNLRTVIKELTVKENINIKILPFSIQYKPTPPFWLTWDEVETMQKCKLSDSLEVVRDEFIFRCYTGLRQGDTINLSPANFKETKEGFFMDFHMAKTDKPLNIQISSHAYQIIKQYDFKFPYITPIVKNKEIKNIAKLAKITGEIELTTYSGNKTTRKVKNRADMVTTHTARRTFARRWADKGGDILQLSKYLGHSSPTITINYIGYENKEVNQTIKAIFG